MTRRRRRVQPQWSQRPQWSHSAAVLLVATCAAVALVCGGVSAATFTWCGSTTGDWNTGSNWNNGGGCGVGSPVPTTGDTVTINSGNVVTYNGADIQCTALTLNGCTLQTTSGKNAAFAGLVTCAGCNLFGTTGTTTLNAGFALSTGGGLVRVTSGTFSIVSGGISGSYDVTLQQQIASYGTFQNLGGNSGTGQLIFDCAIECRVQFSNSIGRNVVLQGGGDMRLVSNGLVMNSGTTVTWTGLRSLLGGLAFIYYTLNVNSNALISLTGTAYVQCYTVTVLNAELHLASSVPQGSGDAFRLMGSTGITGAGDLIIENTGGAANIMSISMPSTTTAMSSGILTFLGSAASNQIVWPLQTGTFARELRVNCTIVQWSSASISTSNRILLNACVSSAGQLVGSAGYSVTSSSILMSTAGSATNQIYVKTSGTITFVTTWLGSGNVMEYRSEGGLITPGAISGADTGPATSDLNFRSDPSVVGGVPVSIPAVFTGIRLTTFYGGLIYWPNVPTSAISTTVRVTGGGTLMLDGSGQFYVSAIAVHQNSTLIGGLNRLVKALNIYCSESFGTIRALGTGQIVATTSGVQTLGTCERLTLDQQTDSPGIDLGATVSGAGEVEVRCSKVTAATMTVSATAIADGGTLWFSGTSAALTTFNFALPNAWMGRAIGVNAATFAWTAYALNPVRNLTLIDATLQGTGAWGIVVSGFCDCLGTAGCTHIIGASTIVSCAYTRPLGTGAFKFNAGGTGSVTLGQILNGPGNVEVATVSNTPLVTTAVYGGSQLKIGVTGSGSFTWSVPSIMQRPLSVGRTVTFSTNSISVPTLDFSSNGQLTAGAANLGVTAGACTVGSGAAAAVTVSGTGAFTCNSGSGLTVGASSSIVITTGMGGATLNGVVASGSGRVVSFVNGLGTGLVPVTIGTTGFSIDTLIANSGIAIACANTGTSQTFGTNANGDLTITQPGPLVLAGPGISGGVVTLCTTGAGAGISLGTTTCTGSCTLNTIFAGTGTPTFSLTALSGSTLALLSITATTSTTGVTVTVNPPSAMAQPLAINGTVTITNAQGSLLNLMLGNGAFLTVQGAVGCSKILSFGDSKVYSTTAGITVSTETWSNGGLLTLQVDAANAIAPKNLNGDGSILFQTIATGATSTLNHGAFTTANTLRLVKFQATNGGTLQLTPSSAGYPVSVEMNGVLTLSTTALALNNPAGPVPINLTLSGGFNTQITGNTNIGISLNTGANLRCIGSGDHVITLQGNGALNMAAQGSTELSFNNALRINAATGSIQLRAVGSAPGFTPSLVVQVSTSTASLSVTSLTPRLALLSATNTGAGQMAAMVNGGNDVAIDVLKLQAAAFTLADPSASLIVRQYIDAAGVSTINTYITGGGISVGNFITENFGAAASLQINADALSVGSGGIQLDHSLQVAPTMSSQVLLNNAGPLTVKGACALNRVMYTGTGGAFNVYGALTLDAAGPSAIRVASAASNFSVGSLAMNGGNTYNISLHSGSMWLGAVTGSSNPQLALALTNPGAAGYVNITAVTTVAQLWFTAPSGGDMRLALPSGLITTLYFTSPVIGSGATIRLLNNPQTSLNAFEVRAGVTLIADASLTAGIGLLTDDSTLMVTNGNVVLTSGRVGNGNGNTFRVAGALSFTALLFPNGNSPQVTLRSIAGAAPMAVTFPITAGFTFSTVLLRNDEGLNGPAGPLQVTWPSNFNAAAVLLAGRISYSARAWTQLSGTLNFTALTGTGAALEAAASTWSVTSSTVSVFATGPPGTVHTLKSNADSDMSFGPLRLSPGVTVNVMGSSMSAVDTDFNFASVTDSAAPDMNGGGWGAPSQGGALIVTRIDTLTCATNLTVYTLNVTGGLVQSTANDIYVNSLKLEGLPAASWNAQLAAANSGSPRSVYVNTRVWTSGPTALTATGNVVIGGDVFLMGVLDVPQLSLATGDVVQIGGAISDEGFGFITLVHALGATHVSRMVVTGAVRLDDLELHNSTFMQLSGNMALTGAIIAWGPTNWVSVPGNVFAGVQAGDYNASLTLNIGTGNYFAVNSLLNLNPEDGFVVNVNFATATAPNVDLTAVPSNQFINFMFSAPPTATVALDLAPDMIVGFGIRGGGTLDLGGSPQTQLRNLWLHGDGATVVNSHLIGFSRGGCALLGPVGAKGTIRTTAGSYNITCPSTAIAQSGSLLFQVDGPSATIAPGPITGAGPGRTASVEFKAATTPAYVLFRGGEAVSNMYAIAFTNAAPGSSPAFVVRPPSVVVNSATTVVLSGAIQLHTRAWVGGVLNFTAGIVSSLFSPSAVQLSRTNVGAGAIAAITMSGPTASMDTSSQGIVLNAGAVLNITSYANVALGPVASVTGSGTELRLLSTGVALMSSGAVRVDTLTLSAAVSSYITFVHDSHVLCDSLRLTGTTVTSSGNTDATLTTTTLFGSAASNTVRVQGTGVITVGTTQISNTFEVHSDSRPVALGLLNVVASAVLYCETHAAGTQIVTVSAIAGTSFGALDLRGSMLQLLSGSITSAACYSSAGASSMTVTGTSSITCATTNTNAATDSLALGLGSGATLSLGNLAGAAPITIGSSGSLTFSASSITGSQGALIFSGPGGVTWNAPPAGVQRALAIASTLTVSGGTALTSLAYLNLTGSGATLTMGAGQSFATVSAASGGECRVTAESGGASITVSGAGSITCGRTVVDGGQLVLTSVGGAIALGDTLGAGGIRVIGSNTPLAFSTGSVLSAAGAALRLESLSRVDWAVPVTGCPRPLQLANTALYISGNSLKGMNSITLAPGSIVTTGGADLNVTATGTCTASTAVTSYVNVTNGGFFSCGGLTASGASASLYIRVDKGAVLAGTISGAGLLTIDSARDGSADPMEFRTGSLPGTLNGINFVRTGAGAGTGAVVKWLLSPGATVVCAVRTFGPLTLSVIGQPSAARIAGSVLVSDTLYVSGVNVTGTLTGGAAANAFVQQSSVLGTGWSVTGTLNVALDTVTVQSTGSVTTAGTISTTNTVLLAPLPGTGGITLPTLALSAGTTLRVRSPSAAQTITLVTVTMSSGAAVVDIGDASVLAINGAVGGYILDAFAFSTSTATLMLTGSFILQSSLGFGATSASLVLNNGVIMNGCTVSAAGTPQLTLGANTQVSGTDLVVPWDVTVAGNSTVDVFGPYASLSVGPNAFLHFSALAAVNPPLSSLSFIAPAGLLHTGPGPVRNISTNTLTTRFDGGARTAHVSHVALQVLAASGSAWAVDLLSGADATVVFRNNATAYVQNGGVRVACSDCAGDASTTALALRSDSLFVVEIDGSTPFDFTTQTIAPTPVVAVACLYTPRGSYPSNVQVFASNKCTYGGAVGCALNPCSSAGTQSCTDLPAPAPVGSFTCNCAAGWTGARCQTDINECASNPCPGPCIDGVNGYTCVPSPCVSSPCHNAGTCVDTSVPSVSSSFTCTCAKYWSGALCNVWVDPCTVEQCYFGKICQRDMYATSYQCVCGPDNCGAGNQNEAAQEAALAQAVTPSFVSLIPSSSAAAGGADLTLVTQGFTGAITVQFALYSNSTAGSSQSQSQSHAPHFSVFSTTSRGVVTTALTAPVTPNTTEDMSAARYLRQLKHSFRALPYAITKSTYRMLVVNVVPDDGSPGYQLSDAGALYYPFNPCLNPNELLAFDSAGVPYCTACPSSGYCPGGGRVWPRAGYWSTSEFATPIACQLPAACPGALGELSAYPPRNHDDGSRVTDMCADGYGGAGCAQCATGYYQSGLRCFSCGASDSDEQQLRFLIAAAVIVFLALTVAVASLSSRYLAIMVSGLLSLQQFVVIGKSSIQQLPASLDWLAQVIGFLSVINFDVQMVKPGCIVPQLRFLDLYWATIVLAVGFAALFIVGAALRATWVYHFRLKNRVQFLRAESDDVNAAAAMASGSTGAGAGAGDTTGIASGGAVELVASTPLAPASSSSPAAADTPVIRAGVGPGGHSRHHSHADSHAFTGAALTRGATSANVHATVAEDGAAGSAVFGGLNADAVTSDGKRRDSPVISPLAALLGGGGSKPSTPPTSAGVATGVPTRAGRVGSDPVTASNRGAAAAVAVPVPVVEDEEEEDERAAAEAAGIGSTDERDWARTWTDVFVARTALSLLILGSIVFLKIFTLLLNCAYCVEQTGVTSDETRTSSSTRLVIDPQIECYTGEHLRAVIFNYVMIVFYGIGFPLLSAVLLYRAFHSPQQTKPLSQRARDEIAASADPEHTTKRLLRERQHRYDAKRADWYGYMFRGLLPTAYYFRLSVFVTNWGFALQQVFTSSVSIQLFVPGVFFLLNMTGTAYLWPYLHNWNNIMSVGVGFGGVGQVLVYLGLLSRDSSGSGSSVSNNSTDTNSAIKIFLYWMAALAFLSVVFVVIYRSYQRRQAARLRAEAKRKAADDVHAARLAAEAAAAAAHAGRVRTPSHPLNVSVVSPPAGHHSRKPSGIVVVSPGASAGVASPLVGGRASIGSSTGGTTGGTGDDEFSPHHPAAGAAAPGGVSFAPSNRGARVSGTTRPPPLITSGAGAAGAGAGAGAGDGTGSSSGRRGSPVIRPPRTPPTVQRSDRISPNTGGSALRLAAPPGDDASAVLAAAVARADGAVPAEGHPSLPPGAALVVSPGADARVVLSGSEAMAYIQRAQNEA